MEENMEISIEDIKHHIDLCVKMHPSISEYIELSKLEGRTVNELYEECLELSLGCDNETKRKEHIVFLLVIFEVLIKTRNKEYPDMIDKIKINFTSIRGFIWCSQMQDDIISLYELNSDRQDKMDKYIDEILKMELNEGSMIMPFIHEPVLKLVGIVNGEEMPDNMLKSMLFGNSETKECIIL